MNQQFNLTRFGRLFAKHTAENATAYLLGTAVLLGGIGLVLGWLAYIMPDPLDPFKQALLFRLGLCATGIVFSSMVFASLGDPRRATAALLVPASHLEKYLVGWLYSTVLFGAVFVGCFFLIDSLVVAFDDVQGPPVRLVRLFSVDDRLYESLGWYALLNAGFLVGSLYFGKLQFVKTAVAVLLVGLGLWGLNIALVASMIPGKVLHSAMPFSDVVFGENQFRYSLELAPAQTGWLLALPVGLTLLGWLAGYFRLTEKQV